MERIYSAAIWYKDLNLPTAKYNPININRGVVVEGHRHADVIKTLYNLTGKKSVPNGKDGVGEMVQGFVTNTNRFVDRVDAMTIARQSHQVISKTKSLQLYSEDLY